MNSNTKLRKTLKEGNAIEIICLEPYFKTYINDRKYYMYFHCNSKLIINYTLSDIFCKPLSPK